MPDIIDLIAQDSKASDISQNIKDTLYSKAAEKIALAYGRASGDSSIIFYNSAAAFFSNF